MLQKLQAVQNRFEELCARSEQPDFYNDPKKAAAILREKNDLEPLMDAFAAYRSALQEMEDAQALMSEPDMVKAVKTGKKCFGMVVEAIPTVVPILVGAMLEQKK